MTEVRARVRPVQPGSNPAPAAAPEPIKIMARSAPKLAAPKVVEEQKQTTFAELKADSLKHHGPHAIRMATTSVPFKHIPTNIFTLDFALGGGIPEGLCTMLYGNPSGGKSTVLWRLIGAAQRKYPTKMVALCEPEGTLDIDWARIHGVDPSRLAILDGSSGEENADLICGALEASDVCLVALDSVPMLMPMKEAERSFEDGSMVANGANLITRFLRKANYTMTEQRKVGNWPTMVLINQWRTKPGVTHGDPRTLPGGGALNYVASVKVEIKNKEITGSDARGFDCITHNEHSFTIHKNKVINGARLGEFKMVRSPDDERGVGYIDEAPTVVSVARKFGLVTGGGSSWRIDGVEDAFRTLAATAEAFEANPEFYSAFKTRLIGLQRGAMGKSETGWL